MEQLERVVVAKLMSAIEQALILRRYTQLLRGSHFQVVDSLPARILKR